MTEVSGGQPEFANLWPTLILVHSIPGAPTYHTALCELASKHPGEGVFRLDNAAIVWLRAQLSHAITQLMVANRVAPDVRWGIRAQFQCLQKAQYETLKNRPGAYLSGVYFIDCPPQATDENRDDLSPGCVSFFDPRPAMNMNAIKHDPYDAAEQVLTPTPGLLLMWPSFVRYFTHPNLSARPAYRIVFDVMLDVPNR